MAAQIFSVEGGIYYIASQTKKECYYDAVQNILMFADFFRPIFARLTKDLIIAGDGAHLMSRSAHVRDAIFTALGVGRGDSDINKFVDFLVETMRRYALIKYNECGLTTENVEALFGVPITTVCFAGARREVTPSIRRQSINRGAGPQAAQVAREALGIVTAPFTPLLTLTQVAIRKIPLLKELFFTQNFNTALNKAVLLNPYNAKAYSWRNYFASMIAPSVPINKNLVAIVYKLERHKFDWNAYVSRKTGEHIVSIIRYHNEYYFCDNEVGIAVLCYDAHNKDEFLKNIGKQMILNYILFFDNNGWGQMYRRNQTVQIGSHVLPIITIPIDESKLVMPITKDEIDEYTSTSCVTFHLNNDALFESPPGEIDPGCPGILGAAVAAKPIRRSSVSGAAAGAGGRFQGGSRRTRRKIDRRTSR